MKVLVVRTSALGDVVLTTPLLCALRALPAEVDLLTSPAYAPLFAGHPDLAAVLTLDRHDGLWRKGRELRARRYDAIVDLQHKARTVMVGILAGARRRLVLRKRRLRDLPRSLRGLPLRLDTHTVDLYAGVAAPLGVPPLDGSTRRLHLPVQPGALARVDAWLRAEGLHGAPLVLLCPGAAHATKRWGARSFAALGKLAEARGEGVALGIGGPTDRDELSVVEDHGVRCAPWRWPLVDFAALLSRGRVLVVGDSGPQHLAAAVGTPVLSLFGPTNPARWSPVGVAHEILRQRLDCMPCSDYGGARCPVGTHACMRDLTVEVAHAALSALLRRAERARP